jgi:pantetheine-phosphate adenylyltransferase
MKIAVYAGSFNPFHKGHMNILLKAEQIFDKVIIARGINPEKSNVVVPLPEALDNREVMQFSGLLTDFVKNIKENVYLDAESVTVVRGLRNTTDLQFELNQYRYFQDLMPEIQVVSIFCDREFEHISSSGIRALSTFGKEHVEKYLI